MKVSAEQIEAIRARWEQIKRDYRPWKLEDMTLRPTWAEVNILPGPIVDATDNDFVL